MRDEKSGKESKQVNFRIDPDSAEAFRLFCTTHGMNQAQGFDHLIQVLELNNAKAATPGRAVEIENFERLLKEKRSLRLQWQRNLNLTESITFWNAL